MILYKRTRPNARYALVINKHGISTQYQRPKVGGGWYNKDGITVAWPWIKVS